MADWDFYRAQIIEKIGWSKLPYHWLDIDDYKGPDMSISSLWSWRGAQCKKYLGYYPKPEEIGLEPDHPFYDPDYIDLAITFGWGGVVKSVKPCHHGRPIRRNERLWREQAVPELKAFARRHPLPNGFKWA